MIMLTTSALALAVSWQSGAFAFQKAPLPARVARPGVTRVSMVGRKVNVPPKRDGFKQPDIMTYMDRYKKPQLKKEASTFEDDIVGFPIPFEADADGNWEMVLGELFSNVDEVRSILKIKLNDQNDELDFSRFDDFCENYKTKRGLIKTDDGRIMSAQTYIDFKGADGARRPILDAADFPWIAKLAKRLSYQTYFEHQIGLGSETISEASWSRVQVMKTHETKWEVPAEPSAVAAAKARGEGEDEGDAAASAMMREQAEKSVALSADDVSTPLKASTTPTTVQPASAPEGGAPSAASDEADLGAVQLPPAWEQLVLNQGTPWTQGAIRFTGSMDSLQRYDATSPPPRNVILGKLPPNTSTKPRTDLQNCFLTMALPLRHIDGHSGMTVGGETVMWEQDKPVIFDSTYEYSMFNNGDETAFVALVDFWHPAVTPVEKRLLGFFWTMWTQDKFHPSTRSRYTRRLARMKEYGEKVAEKKRAQLALPKKRLEERKKRQQGGQGGPQGGGGSKPGGR